MRCSCLFIASDDDSPLGRAMTFYAAVFGNIASKIPGIDAAGDRVTVSGTTKILACGLLASVPYALVKVSEHRRKELGIPEQGFDERLARRLVDFIYGHTARAEMERLVVGMARCPDPEHRAFAVRTAAHLNPLVSLSA